MSKFKKHVGEILFFPRGDTFVKVVSIEEVPSQEVAAGLHLMKFIDLRDNSHHGSNFAEEIGEEFYLLPKGLPQSKIDAFLAAADQRDQAAELMVDVMGEIMLGPLPKNQNSDK